MTNYQHANRCLVAKDYPKAIEFFLRHARECPAEAAHAYAGVAECYLNTNTLQRPVSTAPGVTLVFQGDRGSAEYYFRLALAADPNNARALWGLAGLLPESSEERRELLERSVAVLP